MGSMAAGGWQLTDDPDHAEVLILNTCGFIQPAVEEAIAEIFELVRLKERSPGKKIVVVGCLVQRYQEQLAEDLPESRSFCRNRRCSRYRRIYRSNDTGQGGKESFAAEENTYDE